MSKHILHLEDELEWRDIVTDLLSNRYFVHSATTLHIAAEMLIEFIEAKQFFSAAIFDLSLVEGISNPFRGQEENEDALEWIGDLRTYMREKSPHLPPLPIIVLSAKSETVLQLQEAPEKFEVIGAFDKGTLADETERFEELIDQVVTAYEQQIKRHQRSAQQAEPTR